MRDLLKRADLDRYAGQFVWLELNFDTPANRVFLTKYGANATPTFFVIDPRDRSVTAMQPGAMSLPELEAFLERGAAGYARNDQSSAAKALKHGDSLRASRPREALEAYQQAIRLAPAGWDGRELAMASLVGTLEDDKQWQLCAETAIADAGQMSRGTMFARTVVSGMWCIASDPTAAWASSAMDRLEPLAREALSLSTTVRDHRDELYRTLMLVAVARHETATAGKLGNQWLAELDAITPASDEERSALDIARVENVQAYGDARRILPALKKSEAEMPTSYYASLRLAQAEIMANEYRDAVAACHRGLARSPGAIGRSWLLRIKAQGLAQIGDEAEARRSLRKALVAAREIPSPDARQRTSQLILEALTKLGGRGLQGDLRGGANRK